VEEPDKLELQIQAVEVELAKETLVVSVTH
jgi:hypothetical protein